MADPDALNREVELRWAAHEREHAQHEASHAREHEMTTLALGKAETTMDRRLEGMNEFRAELTRQAATFWTKGEQEQYATARNALFDSVDKRLDILERAYAIETAERAATKDTLTKRMWIIGLGVGIVTFAISLLARLAGA